MSKSVSEALLFPVADTLQVALHLVGEGFKAHQPVDSKVGLWGIKHEMQVKSDVLSPKAATFFVKVRKNLWLYVVSYAAGTKLKCMVFDASVAKIASGFMSTACGQGDLTTSVKRLTAINALMYEFDKHDNAWKTCADFDDVLAK